MIKKVLPFVLVTITFLSVRAQSSSTRIDSPFFYEASYTGDYVSNISGGIKTGATYLGLANLEMGFNTQKANWWRNGLFFINVGNTHGGMPSAKLIGDFQGVSNIEAGDMTFMYELWFKQIFNKITMTAGLQDLNVDFATSQYGALFNNSSFGIHSSIAHNISSPIFPLTALGLSLQWNISPSLIWEAAIFDGTPDNLKVNPYNVHWKLSKNDGFLAITELQFSHNFMINHAGTYKLGAYYQQHNDSVGAFHNDYGLYAVIDQPIMHTSHKGLIALFSQLGISPRQKNSNNAYCSLGLHYQAPFANRPNDEAGIAVAYAGIHDNNSIGGETTLELAYHFQLNQNIYLKPDIQYIINPAGTDAKLPNALVGTLRLGIAF